MSQGSWDNDGVAAPSKGMGTGMKVLLGCGITVLVLLGSCTVAGLVIGRMARNDPEGFRTRIEGWAKGMIQPKWDRLRKLVDELQTDEGAQRVYQANPGLHEDFPSEARFLEAVRRWRPQLTPLPAEAPVKAGGRRRGADFDRDTEGRFQVSFNNMFGTSTLRCRYPDGGRLVVTLDGERITHLEWH